jgi:general secretion pathway protein E
LHTNDAASAVTRLLDMGVEDFLITSTITGLVAQRLIRLLCVHCREPYQALPDFAARMEIATTAPITLHRAKGCEQCGGTGYFGRSSIVEVLAMSDAVRQLVLSRADTGAIRKQAIANGMQSMHAHGMKKALAGETSVEEVLRATRMV